MTLPSPRGFVLRAGLLIAVSTIVVTSSFVGIWSIVAGESGDIGQRLPFYLIWMGTVFVITIVILEEQRANPRVIIVTAVVVSSLGFIAIGLTVEGALFAINNPGRVFVSQLVFYFIAAGLIGTGIGYWGIKHWREFASQPNNRH